MKLTIIYILTSSSLFINCLSLPQTKFSIADLEKNQMGQSFSRFYRYGTEKASKIAARLITNNLSNIDLPDIDTIEEVKPFGNVHLIITEINLIFVNSSEKFSNGQLLNDGMFQILLNDSNFLLQANIRYEQIPFPYFKGHGLAHLNGQEGSIGSKFTLLENFGILELTVIDTPTVEFTKVDVTFTDSKASWFYNLVAKAFKTKLHNLVCEKISEIISNVLPAEANKLLSQVPQKIQISEEFSLATVISSPPLISKDRITATVTGVLESSKKKLMECPYEMRNKTLSKQSNEMLEIITPPEILKCLTWTLFTNEILKFDMKRETLPEVLKTKTWESAIPQLKTMYPAGKNMSLKLNFLEEPHTSISSEGILIKSESIQADFLVDDVNSDVLFSLYVKGDLGISFSIFTENISNLIELEVNFFEADFDVDLNQSNIGKIDIEKVKLYTKVGVASGLENLSNYLKNNHL
ncbi:hypothetical protein HK099_007969, partial [Clydaea vesicula]